MLIVTPTRRGYKPPERSGRPDLLPMVHGVYWTCDLRSLHWLMRIRCRPVTSTHTGAGEPVAGVWRGGLGCHWMLLRARGSAVSYTHLRAHETPEHLVC